MMNNNSYILNISQLMHADDYSLETEKNFNFLLSQSMNGGVLFILYDDDDYKLSVVQIANDRLSSTTSAKFRKKFFPISHTLFIFSTRDD